jgi:hypothetical protein
MPFDYSPASRNLQDRFDTRRLADRLAAVTVHHQFTEADRRFIEQRDMFFLATVDDQGQPTCSYRCTSRWATSARPARVGLLFIDFQAPRRIRVDGTAEIALTHPLLDRYPEAQFITVVRALAIYPNCPRYIHHYQLEERSRFVPQRGAVTPTPDWKRTEWARDVLPAGDPAIRPQCAAEADGRGHP